MTPQTMEATALPLFFLGAEELPIGTVEEVGTAVEAASLVGVDMLFLCVGTTLTKDLIACHEWKKMNCTDFDLLDLLNMAASMTILAKLLSRALLTN